MAASKVVTMSPSYEKVKSYMEKPDREKKNNRQILTPLNIKKKRHKRRDHDVITNRENLRKKQPILTKQETTVYHYSYKHNLCLDILENGFHHSFHELFDLLKQQEEARQEAGPESLLWSKQPLSEQHEKLEKLQQGLTRAEESRRKDDPVDEYNARYELAIFFSEPDDRWLADHFYNSCLIISKEINNDDGQAQAEGHCNVGLCLQQRRDNARAAEHFEEFYKLSSEHRGWLNRRGTTMIYDACLNLCNIYTLLGNEARDDESVEFYKRAYDRAKESNDRHLIAETGYTLGLAFSKNNDSEMALKYLREFLDQCQRTSDIKGIGRACDSIAKIYKENGNMAKCREYLRIFVGIAENSNSDEMFSKACHNLGSIYNDQGEYQEATDFFGKAYNLSRSLSDHRSIHSNRVMFGVALGHNMLGRCNVCINDSRGTCLEPLSEWKSSRNDKFTTDIELSKKASKDESLHPSLNYRMIEEESFEETTED